MDMTGIAEAVVTLLAAIITGVVVPWIKAKTTAQQQDALLKWVKVGVAAAEQIYAGSGQGAKKKKWVLDFLAKNGMKVDSDAVMAAIEGAVYGLKG